MDKVLRDIDRANAASPPKGSSFTRGDNIRGPYSDVKAQSRPGSGKYKSSSRNYDPKNNPSFGSRRGTRKFNNSYEYDFNNILLEQIINYSLFETAETGSGFGGGTEIADTYVDKVSETSSPEELEKASNDANDIAKESGQGLSDADLAKIDQDAAAEARRVTNIRISDPESMDGDQLFDALSLMYDADEEITDQLMDQYESLLDIVALDESYEKYTEREEYLSSIEYDKSVSSEYARQYDTAQNLWNNYFSRGFDHKYAVFTRDNVPYWWNGRTPEEGQTFTVSSLIWDDTGKEFSSSEYQKVRQWSAAGKRRDDLYLSKVYPEKKRQRDLNRAEYKTLSNSIFRPYIIAMIRGWNEMFGVSPTGDPYSLDEPIRHDVYGELALLGISFLAARNLQSALGAAKLASLTRTMNGLKKLKNWWNKGRDGTVPGENTASMKDLKADDLAQGAKFVDPKTGELVGGPLPTNLQQLGDFLTGRGGFTWSVNPFKGGGLGTGPTALTRQLIERPFRAMMKLFESSNLKGNLLTEETSDQKKLYDSLDAALKETDIKDFGKVIDTFIKMIEGELDKKKKISMESHQPIFLKNRERNNLTETRTPKQKRILREIKQPIKVKEAPTKYKMNFEGKFSAQNTPDKTASAQSDALVASGNAKGQKWKQQDKYWSGYETTERMNIIHDRVGHGKQAWDMILDEAKEKNGWRTREMQEELNKIAHERAMLKENPDYTSPFGNVEVSTTEKNLQNFEKVNKIKKVVSDKKVFSNKEIKPEYPEDDNKDREGRAMRMIQQMDQQKEYAGSKAQTGENAAARYKRLDPISAKSMPDAGYPQIDQLRDQARKKAK